MRTMPTADGYEVKAKKMFFTTPWEGVTKAIPYTSLASWHYLDDNREEPTDTNMYSVAMRLEGDIIPNVDDCFCGSHAYVSTIVHVKTNESFGEALEARILELVWEDIAINWDY
jgi:hypothetical protein